MVLLKNDGVLPLRSVKRIAVVGPLADQTAVLLGNYNGNPTHTVSAARWIEGCVPGGEDHLRSRHSVPFQPGERGAHGRAEHA